MRAVAGEFFQLFKTPWEFYQPGKRYSVIIYDSSATAPSLEADIVAIYASDLICGPKDRVVLEERVVPIYRGLDRLAVPPSTAPETSDSPGFLTTKEGIVTMRFTYNLFREVEFLLREGQPAEYAEIPTLEIHIQALRSLLVRYLSHFVEIPPVPAGVSGIASLTHDVDHPSILNHKGDRTLAGFVYRATIGSLVDLLSRRKTLSQLWQNLRAVSALPLVLAGRHRDLWDCFDRYLELEDPYRSTFFFIPVKGDPGRSPIGERKDQRSSPYGAAELSEKISTLRDGGAEIGVHGINAWSSAEDGRKEREAITGLAGAEDIGIRMHWLYYDRNSPQRLDHAGFAYDSTVGYNETVGFKSGTPQVYQPLGSARMLELPLTVMDTALFYPSYLRLRPNEALARVGDLLSIVQQFGGVLVVNWHDRSLAPERLWDGVYEEILLRLRESNIWVAPAREVVQWFRARRETVFSVQSAAAETISVSVRSPERPAGGPSFRLRVYQRGSYTDTEISGAGSYEFKKAA